MRRKNNNILLIAILVLVAILAVGVGFSIVKATNLDKTSTLTNSVLSWQIGRLDDDGDFVQDTSVMMTKKHLPLAGLQVDVVAKPTVDVYVGIFDKNGEMLNGSEVDGDLVPYQIQTSTEEATTWKYAEYVETLELAEGVKPAYAIVFVDPINDVEISTGEIYTYAKQLTVSYNR